MKNFTLIVFNTIILVFIINALIVLVWPIISDYRNQKHSYINEQKNLLDLKEEDLIILQNETWRKNYKYEFIPFIGHSEIDKNGKFVNFTKKNGRRIQRPTNCIFNIYLYGGSTTFGYSVTDYQTIGQYLQDILPKEYCVFNHGRSLYYSKQENNLFLNHIENDRKIHYAFFLDGYNERCGGYGFQNIIANNFSHLIEKPYLLWKKSFLTFLYSTPIFQLYLKFFNNSWAENQNYAFVNIENCQKDISLNELFEKRVSHRHAICKIYNIQCFSFLQPMAGIHGIQDPKLLSLIEKNSHIKKYNILSKSTKNQYIIDLGYLLNNESNLSYIDAQHYSPETNKKMAQEYLSFISRG